MQTIMKKMKQLDLFGKFRHVEDTATATAATATAPSSVKPVKPIKTNTVKTKHSVGDLITYAGQYYEIGEICLPNYKLKGLYSNGMSVKELSLSARSKLSILHNDTKLVTIPKKQQYLIFSYLRFMERYNKTIKRLIKYSGAGAGAGAGADKFDYLKIGEIDKDMRIIKRCGLTAAILNKMEEALKYSRDESLQLHNICVNPYDFIREDYQLITFDRAEKICGEFDLYIPFDAKCEKFPYDLIRIKNSFYIESSYFKYMFEKYCAGHCAGNVSCVDDFTKVVEKTIINKRIKSIDYITTPYLIELEKTLSDLIISLFYDKTEELSIDDIEYQILRFEEYQRGNACGIYHLEPEQKSAVINTMLNKLNVITGFPGTGKSEIVKCILFVNSKLCAATTIDSRLTPLDEGDDCDELLDEYDLDYCSEPECSDYDYSDYDYRDYEKKGGYVNSKNISILAPTGLAFLNIARNQKSDAYNDEISGTCHRIVYNIFPKIKSCFFNSKYRGKCKCMKLQDDGSIGICKNNQRIKLLVIDEFSMVDIFLFRDILNMCKFFGCRLLLVGDNNQLQSIGPGAVLRDIILSGIFNVTKLTTIKRQSAGALINCIKEMNYGLIFPDDFTDTSIQLLNIGGFIGVGSGITADAIVKLIYTNKLTTSNSIFLSYFKSDKYLFNTPCLNNIIQSIFNPMDMTIDKYIPSGDKFENKCRFIVGDRILRIENDYTGKIMRANGEQAHITEYDTDKEIVTIQYTSVGDKPEKISIYELYENFVLAYCLTVHKSQGSQYDNVVIFIDKNQFIWDKTALYTAISRAKLRCFIVSCCADFIKTQNNNKRVTDKISLLLKESDNYEFLID